MSKNLQLLAFSSVLVGLMTVSCISDNERESNSPTYSVSGTITGLDSGTLKLTNNGDNQINLAGNSSFTFSKKLFSGNDYNVKIKSRPAGYSCTVHYGTGTISSSDIIDVRIACSTAPTYSIGVTVSGLVGSLDLLNNGGDTLSITSDGDYTFSQELNNGDDYDVTVQSSPTHYTCDISNGSGTVSSADVTNVDISCSQNPTYATGGTVTGLLSGTLDLLNNGTDPVSITSEGSYSFNQELFDGDTYDVTIDSAPDNYSCTVFNGSGTVSGSDITDADVDCIVLWDNPSSLSDNISPDGQNVFSPQVAMDSSGNAIVVWVQSDGSEFQVFKSEYRSGTWTHPSSLSDNISPGGNDVDVSYVPQVAMDNNGNAVIVWTQYNGSSVLQVYKSERRGGTWTNPANLNATVSTGGIDTFGAQVAMDNNGNAIITWEQFGSVSKIYKSEYRSSSWSSPTAISPAAQHAFDSQIAMDDDGNALIVWREADGSHDQIFKSEYRSGSWTNPSGVTDNISPNGQDAGWPQVAMDDNGNAIIAWHQSDGANQQIFKSEYRSGSWTNPSSLNDNITINGQEAGSPQVAMDNNGNAIIVWIGNDPTNNQVFKSEYRSGSWTNPTLLSDNVSPDGQGASSEQVAMDNNGNAVITWYESDGSKFQIFKSDYRNGSWTNPASLTDNISVDGQHAFDPQVAMGDNGDSIIVWRQSNGSNAQVFKSEYRP